MSDCGASVDSESLVSAYILAQLKILDEITCAISKCRYSRFLAGMPPVNNATMSLIRLMSQGILQSLQYRGCPVLKSVFDIGIEQSVISEIRPKNIIELSAGSGASASWYRDQLAGLHD